MRWAVRSVMLVAAVALVWMFASRASDDAASRDWPAYGGTPQNIRYSELTQINRTNVSRLEVAWTYDAMDGPGGLQTQPIVVDGVLYANTPKHRVIALDAGTGALLWKFDSGLDASGGNRGVTWWSSGSDRRIFAGIDRFVYALDATTGKPIASFGKTGRIDLHLDLGRDPDEQSVRLTTPGIIYRDLLIVGGRVSESLPASPGDIRAYDAADWRAALDVSHDSASGRARVRHLAPRRLALHRRREQLGRHGPRRSAWHRVRPDGIRSGGLLRRQPAGRQPLRKHAPRARRRDRQANLALSGRPARHPRSRFSRTAEPRDRHASRTTSGCRRADE